MKRLTSVLVLVLIIAIGLTMFAGCSQETGKEGNMEPEPQAADQTREEADSQEQDTQETEENEDSFEGDFPFGGSTTLDPIIVSAIEAFADIHPNARLSYDSQGSSVGVQGAIDGVYVLGGASRELKDEEMEQGAVAIPIALDGIAVIVNQDVNVDNLSLEEVAKIFSGEIRNWKDVGGNDEDIVVVNRDESSGTRVAFLEMALQSVLGKDAEFIMEAVTSESNGDMVTKVGSTPGAIGYCGFGYLEQARDAGGKDISVDGIEPDEDNVKNGSFPISRRLNMIHNGELEDNTLAKAFIDFLLSDEGQDIAEDSGFIRLN